MGTYLYRTRDKDGNWTEISEQDVEQLSLDDGTGILAMHGNYTEINHYVGTFWCHILGARTFCVYFQLIRHCYGQKNRAWPSMRRLADLCGFKDVKTVRTALEELEQYGLVKAVQVYNTEKNLHESNLYIVRRTTPLITSEQYKKLPDWLQREHDTYIAKLVKSRAIRIDEVPEYRKDSSTGKIPVPGAEEGTGKNPEGGGKNPVSKSQGLKGSGNFPVSPSKSPILEMPQGGGGEFKEGVGEELPTKNTYSRKQLEELTLLLQQQLEKRVSPSSYYNFFSRLVVCSVENNVVFIRVPHNLSASAISKFYRDLLIEILQDLGILCHSLQIEPQEGETNIGQYSTS